MSSELNETHLNDPIIRSGIAYSIGTVMGLQRGFAAAFHPYQERRKAFVNAPYTPEFETVLSLCLDQVEEIHQTAKSLKVVPSVVEFRDALASYIGAFADVLRNAYANGAEKAEDWRAATAHIDVYQTAMQSVLKLIDAADDEDNTITSAA